MNCSGRILPSLGEGKLHKEHLTLSKYRYVRKQQEATLTVRYNAIGAKVPVAEIDEEFMKDIDYEWTTLYSNHSVYSYLCHNKANTDRSPTF